MGKLGKYIDYIKLMWDTGSSQGKDMKEDHKEKFKKLRIRKKK